MIATGLSGLKPKKSKGQNNYSINEKAHEKIITQNESNIK